MLQSDSLSFSSGFGPRTFHQSCQQDFGEDGHLGPDETVKRLADVFEDILKHVLFSYDKLPL